MYRVCLNAAIDILRKEKSQPKFAKYDTGMGTMTEHKKGTSDNQEKLYLAIRRLSNIDKAIVTLYLDEYSYKEIAEIVGISETNTGVKINRIKSQILKNIQNGN